MDWTDDVIERLRAFWAEGLSTAEIGRRVGVSKNAVVGKAHRLGLIARPSPIKRGTGDLSRRAALPRVVGSTLPPLSSPAEAPTPPLVLRPPVSPAPRLPPVAAGPAQPNVPSSVPAPGLRPVARAPGGRVIPCCWPIGEPGKPSFHFCGAASAGGKPYCSEHAALAYVKVRDRREDAA